MTAPESFHRAGELGVVPVGLARRMAPAAGLRDLLVHRYGDIDVDLLSGATGRVIEDFDAYVGHVARWLADEGCSDRRTPPV